MYFAIQEKRELEEDRAKYVADLEQQVTARDKVIEVLQQTVAEVRHAQNRGSGWYTKGHNGLYQQVRLWLDKSDEALLSIREGE